MKNPLCLIKTDFERAVVVSQIRTGFLHKHIFPYHTVSCGEISYYLYNKNLDPLIAGILNVKDPVKKFLNCIDELYFSSGKHKTWYYVSFTTKHDTIKYRRYSCVYTTQKDLDKFVEIMPSKVRAVQFDEEFYGGIIGVAYTYTHEYTFGCTEYLNWDIFHNQALQKGFGSLDLCE